MRESGFDQAKDEIAATRSEEAYDYESDLDLPGLHECLAGVVVTSTDWTTETILNQLEKGNIDLSPSFQRRNAWQPERKSKFIESLFLNLPIPQIVLAEQQGTRGKFIVIDGKQRLLSLRQFATKADGKDFDQFRLGKLDVKPELSGLSLIDIEQRPEFDKELSAFQNQTIRTVVIRNWRHESVLYLLFLRLNTGSVPLSPQELRQALIPGPFMDFVDTASSDSDGLKRLLDLDEPDFRMRDAEILIRYYAFRNYLHLYAGNLKKFLDDSAKDLNSRWPIEEPLIRKQAIEFEAAIETTYSVFGDDALKKWNGSKYESRLNKAVADIMLQYFSDPAVAAAAVDNAPEIRARFQDACTQDPKFIQSLETTTKSLSATFTRFSVWAKILRDSLQLPVPIPDMKDGKIVLPGR